MTQRGAFRVLQHGSNQVLRIAGTLDPAMSPPVEQVNEHAQPRSHEHGHEQGASARPRSAAAGATPPSARSARTSDSVRGRTSRTAAIRLAPRHGSPARATPATRAAHRPGLRARHRASVKSSSRSAAGSASKMTRAGTPGSAAPKVARRVDCDSCHSCLRQDLWLHGNLPKRAALDIVRVTHRRCRASRVWRGEAPGGFPEKRNQNRESRVLLIGKDSAGLPNPWNAGGPGTCGRPGVWGRPQRSLGAR